MFHGMGSFALSRQPFFLVAPTLPSFPCNNCTPRACCRRAVRMCTPPPSAPIRLLSRAFATYIDSLSIVPTPFAIVQALVENALDAHATTIAIHVHPSRITVADDGSGIPRRSLGMLGVKYASSKGGDVAQVASLGFRGVALAAVRRSKMVESVVIKSRAVIDQGREQTGWEVCVKAEGNGPAKSVAMVGGTVVEVELRESVKTVELTRQVRDWAVRLACLWEAVGLEVWERRKLLWWIKGDNRKERVARLFGVGENGVMLGRTEVEDGGSVEVILGKEVRGQSEVRTRRARSLMIDVGVNGRIVEKEGWEEVIHYILREIGIGTGFSMPLPVLVITKTDNVELGVPTDCAAVSLNKRRSGNEPYYTSRGYELGIGLRLGRLKNAVLVEKALRDAFTRALGISKAGHRLDIEHFRINPQYEAAGVENLRSLSCMSEYEESGEADAIKWIDRDASLYNAKFSHSSSTGLDRLPISVPIVSGLLELSVVAQVLNTYILVERKGGIMLVEQHTADERVKFEGLVEHWTADMVQLSKPVRLPEFLDDARIGNLDALGLGVSEDDSEDPNGAFFTVTKVPSILRDLDAQSLMTHLLSLSKIADAERAAAELACRLAIKNGTRLTLAAMTKIIRNLAKCRAPHLCPHGRPVFIELDETQLASAFKRNWMTKRKENAFASLSELPLPRRGVIGDSMQSM